MSIEQYLREAPKAELHVHLEGAVRPDTLLKLAQRNGASLPGKSVEELQQWFQYRDFKHFIEIYLAISSCLKQAEDYELIAYEFGETMAQQNVRYAEATFSPCTHAFTLGVPFDIYFAGLTRGRERARQDFGVEINWVFDIVRNMCNKPGVSERADYTVKVAKEGMRDGVVALGLGGNEVGHPPEWFERWFDEARAAGLHSDPHAGEIAGPESVWGAVKVLGAERIGHGVRSAEDESLLTYLAEHQIPLEVNPTSNICLGVYPDYAHHPLLKLMDAGIPVTVNTDDPPLFNTTLNHEIGLLHSAFQLEVATINTLLLNGIRYSFLPTERKATLLAEFEAQMLDLTKRHLLAE
ncbi:adenosine deaminase [Ktedonobacter racemifer]|uniref:Adenosine deaminase n=1 Tax=Ktedonobacter racemifer DSM 44963 TaxID=485913 RepID=D6TZ36_KTERA|nr:adenosine deaminase [Ktedonobacter racemifer]EFH81826.1 adenosine deaminase [Ktedonobacter racemifer DSM 44963]